MNRIPEVGTGFQPMKLEVDNSLLEKSLSILNAPQTSEATSKFKTQVPSLFPGSYEGSSIEVTPSPGFCVKSCNIHGKKVFINFCKVSEIPTAAPISEEDLIKIIEEENYETPYRVPMSLGAPREDKDKSTKKCYVTDVAVNGAWFDQVVDGSPVFTAFLVNVAMEGLCDKYGDELNVDRNGYSILRKKNYYGKLQRHRIQKRERKIHETFETSENKSMIEEIKISKNSSKTKKPALKLIKAEGNILSAEIHLPGIRSASELELDLGEDRIKLKSMNKGTDIGPYNLDVFLPLLIFNDSSLAEYHIKSQTLKINMPLFK
ncbi:PIH1 domain-containing protein 1 [Lepeophtheirus salmonis]|uniref:PIH1 domain-containing protein 1 n=1 Tax=Lepeophtheirus salmonis TaxID=72036 RepID=UPI001AE83F32|nr:PIH1 domain-containing protein 1-like [Lepeophtheirus salmonis]